METFTEIDQHPTLTPQEKASLVGARLARLRRWAERMSSAAANPASREIAEDVVFLGDVLVAAQQRHTAEVKELAQLVEQVLEQNKALGEELEKFKKRPVQVSTMADLRAMLEAGRTKT